MIFSSKDDTRFIIRIGTRAFDTLLFDTSGRLYTTTQFEVGSMLENVVIQPYEHDGRVLFPEYEVGTIKLVTGRREAHSKVWKYTYETC